MPNFKFTNKSAYEWLVEQVEGHNSDECLIWPFATTSGYGRVRVPGTEHKALVHRVAFAIAYGHEPVPCALHKCDNPPCFNPRHLFEGTKVDNSDDKVQKRRHVFGETVPRARLTEADVRSIRAMHAAGGLSNREIAEHFGVGESCVQKIVTRFTWKHV